MADEQPDLCAPARCRQEPRSGVGRLPAAITHRRTVETTWRVEYDQTSLAAVDLPIAPGPGGTAGSQARLRFGLANGPAALQYAALVVDLSAGLAGNDRLVFTGRAEQPMRISVQLRSDRGSWQRSVYVDTVDQERTVFFDDLTPAAGADTDSRHAPKSAPSCS